MSRLARIRQVKAASCNAFMDSKRRTELYQYKIAAAAAAAAATQQTAAGEISVNVTDHDVSSIADVDMFQLQHHHLLTCLEQTTVSLTPSTSPFISFRLTIQNGQYENKNGKALHVHSRRSSLALTK